MINIPKGTKDMLPLESYKWHYVENIARDVAKRFGFKEIRTPMFEHTELFLRGVGETTDIVTKEMYTFEDKGGRSITLKPEGTAGVARAYIENALDQVVIPMKTYYLSSIFRYEKPQSGRLREHHQFGVELYGSDSAYADAEVISLANTFLREVGLKSLELNINSIGCPECRAKFNQALKEYIGANLHLMCGQCQSRFEKNPLRILDCKEEKCKQIVANAPSILDFLCDDCKAHFESLQSILKDLGIEFKINPMIVRGLDYYTRTVFEFVSTDIGAQGTVCGGGRYNNLVEEVGGKKTPAVGFGLGLERLLLVLENTSSLNVKDDEFDAYIAPMGENAKKVGAKLAQDLRQKGLIIDCDIMDRGFKAQFKYANKILAKKVIAIGDDEIAKGVVSIKDMATSEQEEVKIEDVYSYLTK